MCHISLCAQSFAYSQKKALRVRCDHENNSVRKGFIERPFINDIPKREWIWCPLSYREYNSTWFIRKTLQFYLVHSVGPIANAISFNLYCLAFHYHERFSGMSMPFSSRLIHWFWQFQIFLLVKVLAWTGNGICCLWCCNFSSWCNDVHRDIGHWETINSGIVDHVDILFSNSNVFT